MTVDPFIEAEEVAGHSVQNACRLLEVSKSAYYQRRNGTPSQRDSPTPHCSSRSRPSTKSPRAPRTPRVHKELLHRHIACGKRKVTRLSIGPASKADARSAGARPRSPTRRPRRPAT